MKTLTFLIPIAITVVSCTHVYYAPNTANAPLLTAKGETRINGVYAEGDISEFTGGELQVATAVARNIGVMVNGMSVSNNLESETEKGNGSYVEFAGGYFKALDSRKKLVFESYGGVGFGGVNNQYDRGGRSKVNIMKLFIQPSLGFKSRYFETAFVPKVSVVNWKVKEKNVSESGGGRSDLNSIENSPHFVAFEPAVLIRAGGKNVKFQMSFSFSDVRSFGVYQADLVEDLNFGLGVSLNFDTKRK